jgi:hypothetical protein
MADLPCINETESLFVLVQKEQRLKRELKEVRAKIEILNTAAKTGTFGTHWRQCKNRWRRVYSHDQQMRLRARFCRKGYRYR